MNQKDFPSKCWPRRRFLAAGAAGALTLSPMSALARRSGGGERSLSFVNLHTTERIETVYWADGAYNNRGMSEIDRVLRDFRTDEVYPIDTSLFDLLYAVRLRLKTTKPFLVISGYRSPRTNAMLVDRDRGVARRSLHMAGMAIDVRLPQTDLWALRTAAVGFRAGGVGYYPKPNFVHIDVGRFRTW
jgi:uncharacterized protein YcbK (DUF882 family)